MRSHRKRGCFGGSDLRGMTRDLLAQLTLYHGCGAI
jgi:hypothetical protein